MDRPVRGSPLAGSTGFNSDGLKPLKTFSRCFALLAALAFTSLCENLRPKVMGGSEVVSVPAAIPHSIWPLAIFAPMVRAA